MQVSPLTVGSLTVYEIYISYVNVCSSSLSNKLFGLDIPKRLLLKELPSVIFLLILPSTVVFTVLSKQGELTSVLNFSLGW